jgi:glucose/arabinose dehydrogenase
MTDADRVAGGFSFPTSLAFAEDGTAYVAESGLQFGGATPGGRVWRLDRNGARTLVASMLSAPVTGLTLVDGALVVSEGGHPARISRISPDGERTIVLKGLPGPGNYHLNMAVPGPDGKLYFGLGAMTNTGIVGLDALALGWLRRLPHAHDVPGYELELTGVNVETEDPFRGGRVRTGAFAAFGSSTEVGQRIAATLPCTASVMRCELDGSKPELVAWGLRNAFGLGFLDGRLFALDHGPDDRGSRPVGNAPDALFEIRQRAWYGWPDYVSGDPITDERYRPERGPAPSFVIANHAELPAPEHPRVCFPPHVAATKFDVSPDGSLVVALFGDEAPLTAPSGTRAGRSLARVDLTRWSVDLFEEGPFWRPIDVRFDPDGKLHVLDFGRFEVGRAGVTAAPGTGAVWRVR